MPVVLQLLLLVVIRNVWAQELVPQGDCLRTSLEACVDDKAAQMLSEVEEEMPVVFKLGVLVQVG